jgi:hypothetical protein
MSAIEYVDFNKEVAKEMWDQVSINLDCFQPIKALREGIAIVATVDVDAAYELSDICAVNIVVLGCELQVDPENEQFNLQAGLNISPELRAVLTIKISRMLKDEIATAIKDCADWIEATAGAPDGFIGAEFPPKEAPVEESVEETYDSDELVEETDEPDPFESDTLNAEVTPSDDD